MTHPITEECRISFVDLTSADGIRIYQRSLIFLLIKAFHDIFPDDEIEVRHSVSKGLFFESTRENLNAGDVERIEKQMQKLVGQNLPFRKETLPAKSRRLLLKQVTIGAFKYRKIPCEYIFYVWKD